MANGGELAYQQLCGNITAEFNDCSKQVSSVSLVLFSSIKISCAYNFFPLQVLEMISVLSMPEFCRSDLGDLLKGVQAHEKEKLHLVSYLGHSLCCSVDHEITLP